MADSNPLGFVIHRPSRPSAPDTLEKLATLDRGLHVSLPNSSDESLARDCYKWLPPLCL